MFVCIHILLETRMVLYFSLMQNTCMYTRTHSRLHAVCANSFKFHGVNSTLCLYGITLFNYECILTPGSTDFQMQFSCSRSFKFSETRRHC